MAKNNTNGLRALSFCLLMACSYFLCSYLIGDKPLFGLCHNITESMPWTWFISSEFKEAERDMYVSFKHEKSQMNLAKKIVGLPGDSIRVINDRIYVNDIDCGIAVRVSRSGKFMTPIAEGIIPSGYVYVASPHPESFDSRYEEFGLVKVEQIEELLWPLI